MKPKSQSEERAAEKQVQYLTEALSTAKDSSGYWLNAAGRFYPRFYGKGPQVSPFNALALALFADRSGYKTNLFTTFQAAKQQGQGVKEKEKGVPFNWYNWNHYVNRHNPDEQITREAYMQLPSDQKENYKGIHEREIRVLFNLDQTLMPFVDPDKYQSLIAKYGTSQERGHERSDERQLHIQVNNFMKSIKDNLVPIRRDGTLVAHYDVPRDAIYVPDRQFYPRYMDFVQDLMREIVRSTGHQQRCAREGMVMKGGVAPTREAVQREELIVELASGVKMLELGLPARLSQNSMKLVEGWNRDLREDPQSIDTLEADINNALDVIRKAEKGEKVTYYSDVNRQQTEAMNEKKKPAVSPEEDAILTDIIRNRGMLVSGHNFKTPEEKKAFLEKFDLAYYADKFNEAMAMTKSEDPEVVDTAYTETLNYASRIDELARGYKPAAWDNACKAGSYTIDEALKKLPNRDTRDFVVVTDSQTKVADVLMPEGAFSGGKVILPDGNTRSYYLSADEVMPEKEREACGARIQGNVTDTERIRHELAQKYYALAKVNPDLRVNLFGKKADLADIARIERVNIYKTKDDQFLCAPVIKEMDGGITPRPITRSQWQRLWLSENMAAYKQNLAASLFADVLHPKLEQEAGQSSGMKR